MIDLAPKKEPEVHPNPESEDELLDEGLEETFPASDPPSATRPHQHDQHVWDQRPETD
jgi:hypothetical protein